MDEKWLPVVGFPGYEVSDQGRVRSLGWNIPNRGGKGTHLMKGRVLSPSTNRRGYKALNLSRAPSLGDPRRYTPVCVHRLVAMAHIGPPPSDRMEVNHINFIVDDNRASNLEWVSRSENRQHSSVHGRLAGDANGMVRLTKEQVEEIVALGREGKLSQRAISEMYAVSSSSIGRILRGESWTFGEDRGVRICAPRSRKGTGLRNAAKLSDEDVRWIRSNGLSKSNAELREMFKVSRTCVANILSGKSWPHIT